MSSAEPASFELLGFPAFDLGQHVEGRVELLAFVFVGVDAELVVVGGGVLPLAEGLHTEELHEGANFNLRELFTELFAAEEVSVFLNRACNLRSFRFLVHGILLSRSREVVVVFFGVFIFPAVVITFSLVITTFFFFTIVSVVIFILLITVVSRVSFLFVVSEPVVNKTLPSGRGTVVSLALLLGETGSHVGLRSLLIENLNKSGCVINGQSSSDFVPSHKFVFIVSHVDGCEQGVHHVLEVAVRAVLVVVGQLPELVQVHE